MTPHEHDDQRARVQLDRTPHDVYPTRAAARAAAQAAAAHAQDMPHILELDDVEREFLADLLQREADIFAAPSGAPHHRRFILELRERIRPSYSAERRHFRDLTRRKP